MQQIICLAWEVTSCTVIRLWIPGSLQCGRVIELARDRTNVS